jgi:hypothetical protein
MLQQLQMMTTIGRVMATNEINKSRRVFKQLAQMRESLSLRRSNHELLYTGLHNQKHHTCGGMSSSSHTYYDHMARAHVTNNHSHAPRTMFTTSSSAAAAGACAFATALTAVDATSPATPPPSPTPASILVALMRVRTLAIATRCISAANSGIDVTRLNTGLRSTYFLHTLASPRRAVRTRSHQSRKPCCDASVNSRNASCCTQTQD